MPEKRFRVTRASAKAAQEKIAKELANQNMSENAKILAMGADEESDDEWVAGSADDDGGRKGRKKGKKAKAGDNKPQIYKPRATFPVKRSSSSFGDLDFGEEEGEKKSFKDVRVAGIAKLRENIEKRRQGMLSTSTSTAGSREAIRSKLMAPSLSWDFDLDDEDGMVMAPKGDQRKVMLQQLKRQASHKIAEERMITAKGIKRRKMAEEEKALDVFEEEEEMRRQEEAKAKEEQRKAEAEAESAITLERQDVAFEAIKAAFDADADYAQQRAWEATLLEMSTMLDNLEMNEELREKRRELLDKIEVLNDNVTAAREKIEEANKPPPKKGLFDDFSD